MFWKRRIRQYNSRTYDLSNTNDFEEFYGIVDTLNDFDFAIEIKVIIYADDYQKSTLHVTTKSDTMETWLIKKGFEEA